MSSSLGTPSAQPPTPSDPVPSTAGPASGPPASGSPVPAPWAWAWAVGRWGARQWAAGRGAVAATGALLLLVALGQATGQLLMIAPLAATAMIICGSPALPPAQPRAVIVGQLGSAAAGAVTAAVLGHTLWAAAAAAGVSIALMGLLRAVHAPAAATAVLAVVQHPDPARFLALLAVGAVVLVLAGVAAARAGAIGPYPARWW